MKVTIDPMEGYVNDPRIILEPETDRENPAHNVWIYDPIPIPGCMLYVAWKGPWCSFMIHDPRRETGYGGRKFELRLTGGGTKTVKGPWSSNSAFVNGYFSPGEHVIECEADGVARAIKVEYLRGLGLNIVRKDGPEPWYMVQL